MPSPPDSNYDSKDFSYISSAYKKDFETSGA